MKPVVGIDIGATAVRVVTTSPPDRRGHVTVKSAGFAPVPRGSVLHGQIINPTAIVEAIKQASRQAGVKKRSLAVAGLVSGDAVVATTRASTAVKQTEWASQIRLDGATLGPTLAPEAARISVTDGGEVADEDSDDRQLVVAAAPRDQVDAYADVVEKAGLRCRAIDLSAAAIVRATTRLDVDPAQEVIVDIGANKTMVILVRDGHMEIVDTLLIGGDEFTSEIARKTSAEDEVGEDLRLEIEKRKQWMRIPTQPVTGGYSGGYVQDTSPEAIRKGREEEALWDVATRLIDRVTQPIDAAVSRGILQPEQIFLTGQGGRMRGLDSLMAATTGLPVSFHAPYATLPDSVTKDLLAAVGTPTKKVADEQTATAIRPFTEAIGLSMWEPTS